ncbi:hypothetical protein RB195_019677 [Necator americanus]|uniref:Uncharacterized protein n=1 Tax=Necator americanus TaxID=51031 RepID=A0ABR1CG23_NECAM
MDDLSQNTQAIRPVLLRSQLARICAPTLHTKSSGGCGKAEVHNFCFPVPSSLHKLVRLSIYHIRVSDRYSSITRRGSSPLMPTEFATVLDAIVHHLLGRKRKKTKIALQYLCSMIPQQLRSHLINVEHFFGRRIGTDNWMSLRSTFYLVEKFLKHMLGECSLFFFFKCVAFVRVKTRISKS